MLYMIRAVGGVLALLGVLMSPAQAADARIGVVDVPRLMQEAPQAQAANSRMQQEFAPREQSLISEQKEVGKLEDRLSRDGAVMSEDERSKLERDILARKREIRRLQDEFREDLNMRRNEELGKVQRDIQEAINAFAKEEQFDLIVGPGVIYRAPEIDVTDQILKRLKGAQ